MRFLILLFVLLATHAAMAQSATPPSDTKEYLVVIAHEMRIAHSFKHGLNAEKARAGSVGEQAEAALKMDDERMEELFADVLASKVSLQEAREAYEFHSSAEGKALLASQAEDPLNASPALTLTPSDIAAVKAYMNSAAGKKLGALVSDPATWDEFTAMVLDSLENP